VPYFSGQPVMSPPAMWHASCPLFYKGKKINDFGRKRYEAPSSLFSYHSKIPAIFHLNYKVIDKLWISF